MSRLAYPQKAFEKSGDWSTHKKKQLDQSDCKKINANRSRGMELAATWMFY